MNRHCPNQFFGRDRDARRLFGANGYSPKQDQNHNACGKDKSHFELANKQGRDPTYTSFVKQSRTASTEPRGRFCVSRDWTCPVERCMFSAVQIPTHAFIHLVPVRCTQYIVCVPTSSVPAAAAEAGKDVVHQLNNAFAKVFETVAPSVVIIELSKEIAVRDT